MLHYLFKDYHLSVFQKLRHSDTWNLVKGCTKHDRPDQSQRELTVALSMFFTFLHFFKIKSTDNSTLGAILPCLLMVKKSCKLLESQN